MARSFPCEKCGSEIIVKYPRPGEKALCDKCRERSAVRELAAEVETAPGYLLSRARPPEPQSVTEPGLQSRETKTIKRFAAARPILFALLALLASSLLSAILMVLIKGGSEDPRLSALALTIGRLGAEACLLYLMFRSGWLRAAGVARLGGRQVWMVSIVLLLYLVPAEHYAEFGKVVLSPRVFLLYSAPRYIALLAVCASIWEETFFRGLALYALLRVWGTSRRGILASAVVAALVFGALHFRVLTEGESLQPMLLNVLSCILWAILWGALVLRWGSIWPGVVLHVANNLAWFPAVSYLAPVHSESAVLVRLLLFKLPLYAFGALLLFRSASRSAVSVSSRMNSIPER